METEFIDWTDTFAPPPGQGSIDDVVGFGEDAGGNLYIVDLNGEIFRVVGPVLVPALSSVWLRALAALAIAVTAYPRLRVPRKTFLIEVA